MVSFTVVMMIFSPCLRVQSEIGGVFEARTDKDGRIEPIGLGYFQRFPFRITPVQILPYPVHC